MEPTDPPEGLTVEATDCTHEYECYQPVVYAADVVFPIVNLGQRDAWTPDVARAGTALDSWPLAIGGTAVRNVTVFLIVAGWTLTAAFVAAVSRTISRA